jgi:nucleoside-diphosphate-sugar epimerase
MRPRREPFACADDAVPEHLRRGHPPIPAARALAHGHPPRDSTGLLNGNDPRIDLYPGLAEWWRQAEAVWDAHKGTSSLSLVQRIEFRPLPGEDPPRRCPDVTRATEVLGWRAQFELGLGIGLMAEAMSAERGQVGVA